MAWTLQGQAFCDQLAQQLGYGLRYNETGGLPCEDLHFGNITPIAGADFCISRWKI
jgi:hypothetical protein